MTLDKKRKQKVEKNIKPNPFLTMVVSMTLDKKRKQKEVYRITALDYLLFSMTLDKKRKQKGQIIKIHIDNSRMFL